MISLEGWSFTIKLYPQFPVPSKRLDCPDRKRNLWNIGVFFEHFPKMGPEMGKSAIYELSRTA